MALVALRQGRGSQHLHFSHFASEPHQPAPQRQHQRVLAVDYHRCHFLRQQGGALFLTLEDDGRPILRPVYPMVVTDLDLHLPITV